MRTVLHVEVPVCTTYYLVGQRYALRRQGDVDDIVTDWRLQDDYSYCLPFAAAVAKVHTWY